VVDLGLVDDELDKLKESIIQAAAMLPPSALVGMCDCKHSAPTQSHGRLATCAHACYATAH
jgi:hypothetical protein